MAIKQITNENFEETINGEKPVFIDFFATWCGPCKMLSPIIDELAEEGNQDVIFAKCDIDECMEIAQQYGIMSVPTMIVFKDGNEASRAVGFHTKEQIKNMLNPKEEE